ncbi:MAG: histone deacetylase [Thermomicrobiales bacterium]|nr:histone deacetylase [Thermomicrobiales bacterium]
MNEPNLPLKKTALVWSDAFLGHDTGQHVETPNRAVAIREALRSPAVKAERPYVSVQPVSLELLERTHDPRFIAELHRFGAAGGGWVDGDTWLGPDSLEVASLSAGAAVEATRAVIEGRATRAFALGRPPGHHATRDRSMGFCLYNNVAVAANAAHAAGIERIAIVDWDLHHGNGTQDIFYDRRDVLFCSIHEAGNYPGSGWPHELGNERGEGFTLNVPLRPGAGDAAMLRAIDEIFTPAIEAYGPELIMISAGFDAHHLDPLGNLQATELGFAQMADRICQLAEHYCENRVVAVLEGGYDVRALARSTAAVISVLDGAAPAAAIPAAESAHE